MRIPAPLRPLVVFVVSTFVLLLTILGSRISRLGALPDEIEFMPKENNLLLIATSLEEAWEAVETHFGPVISDTSRDGTLGSFFREVDESLLGRELEIRSPTDLEAYGIDPDRPLLWSLQFEDPDQEPEAIIAVPVLDQAAFLEFAGRLSELDRSADPILLQQGDRVVAATEFEDELYIAFARDDLALVAGSPRQLERGLFNNAGNRAHFKEDDLLYQSIGGGWFQHRPELFVYWGKGVIPAFGRGTSAVSLDGQRLVVDNRFQVNRKTLTVFEELTRPGTPIDWAAMLPESSSAGLYFADSALSRHLDFVLGLDAFAATSESAYGSLLQLLREIGGLRQLSVAVTGYRDGLPDLLMGLWGDREELETTLRDIQVRLKQERDLELLERALAAWHAQDREAAPSGSAEMEAAGLLEAEDPPLLERYRIIDGRVEAAALSTGDFTGPGYSRQFNGIDVSFLLPPRTANDLRYLDSPADLQAEVYMSDRFRLASSFIDGVLWVATDIRDLAELTSGRVEPHSSLSATLPFRRIASDWGPEHKLQVFFDVDSLINIGLLSAESQIDDALKGYLLDLENHPGVGATLEGRGDVVSLRLELLARTALESR